MTLNLWLLVMMYDTYCFRRHEIKILKESTFSHPKKGEIKRTYLSFSVPKIEAKYSAISSPWFTLASYLFIRQSGMMVALARRCCTIWQCHLHQIVF